jgi:hypothetical protein
VTCAGPAASLLTKGKKDLTPELVVKMKIDGI